ncbi:MAG: hypothetical protein RLZZ628_129 [Bacteroidota bacterium]|jgi:cell division protein FtsX
MKEVEINAQIATALSSLEGMASVEADETLLDSILQRIHAGEMIPMRTVWLAAAGFALIVWVNIACVVFNAHPKHESAASATIARTYLNSKG